MYLVHAVDKDYAVNLLAEVSWESFVQNPEMATSIAAETLQNIVSSQKFLPRLQETQGILYVTVDDATDENSWYFIVLAHVAEKTEDEECPDCEACSLVTECFKPEAEA